MIAGCQYRTCQGVEDGTVRGVSPRKIILAFFDALCNREVAKDAEDATASRQIDSPVPLQLLGRAFASGDDPESGQRVQDAAVQNAQQAVSSKAGTSPDESDPWGLGQIEPLVSEHGPRGARFLPRSLRRAYRRLALVLTTRGKVLLFGLT